jgi:hypothetical protein
MSQPPLFPTAPTPIELTLPAVQFGPVACRIGSIQSLLRSAETLRVQSVEEAQVSPRIKEPLYALENGERIIVTSRKNVARPADVDGVLYRISKPYDGMWIS